MCRVPYRLGDTLRGNPSPRADEVDELEAAPATRSSTASGPSPTALPTAGTRSRLRDGAAQTSRSYTDDSAQTDTRRAPSSTTPHVVRVTDSAAGPEPRRRSSGSADRGDRTPPQWWLQARAVAKAKARLRGSRRSRVAITVGDVEVDEDDWGWTDGGWAPLHYQPRANGRDEEGEASPRRQQADGEDRVSALPSPRRNAGRRERGDGTTPLPPRRLSFNKSRRHLLRRAGLPVDEDDEVDEGAAAMASIDAQATMVDDDGDTASTASSDYDDAMEAAQWGQAVMLAERYACPVFVAAWALTHSEELGDVEDSAAATPRTQPSPGTDVGPAERWLQSAAYTRVRGPQDVTLGVFTGLLQAGAFMWQLVASLEGNFRRVCGRIWFVLVASGDDVTNAEPDPRVGTVTAPASSGHADRLIAAAADMVVKAAPGEAFVNDVLGSYVPRVAVCVALCVCGRVAVCGCVCGCVCVAYALTCTY